MSEGEKQFQELAKHFPGGAFASFKITSLGGKQFWEISFAMDAEDLADPDALPRMYFEPAIQGLVESLKRSPAGWKPSQEDAA